MDAVPPPTPAAGTPAPPPTSGLTAWSITGHAPRAGVPPAPAPVLPEPVLVPRNPDLLHAWPRQAQWALVFLLGAAAALLVAHFVQSLRWGARPAELEAGPGPGYLVDLNRATRA